jgi:hypothetical protein
MNFTRHAFQRYRQFHMLDKPTATDEDARDILERFGPTAKRVGVKTHRGDPVWYIEALGVELVAKHEDGVVTCVTVLPPVRFRGLTPLQAEAMAELAQEARARSDEAQRKVVEAQAALVEHKAAERAIETAGRNARMAAARNAAMVEAKTALQQRIAEARSAAEPALAERDILVSVLKTMRHQMNREERVEKHDSALRIAVRALLAAGATEALVAIASIEPGLASEAFANGGICDIPEKPDK